MSEKNDFKEEFKKEVKKIYKKEVVETSLKAIYNRSSKKDEGKSTDETKKKGVYALFYQGDLKKIGKATDNSSGIFHRMSQYYRGDTNGGLKEIDEGNRDEIKVLYFNLSSEEECWVAERRFQVFAYDHGHKMPWENKSRN